MSAQKPESGVVHAVPEVAADWVARLALGKASAEDVRALKAWLSADPANQQAFDRARRLWVGLNPLEQPARRTLRVKRRPVVASLITLAAAACMAFAAVMLHLVPHDYSSPTGEVRNVTLPDGSRLWLDSDAAADFREDGASRLLKIARGRVHVQVAHEHGRDFRVAAHGSVIRDIGTSFTVDTEGPELRVAVAEGTVQVDGNGVTTRLDAGRAATFPAAGPAHAVTFDVHSEAAWRSARIALSGMTLAETLRQVGRYRRGTIVLLDSEAGERVVSGGIALGDIEGGLGALADSQNLKLVHLPFLLIVTSAQ